MGELEVGLAILRGGFQRSWKRSQTHPRVIEQDGFRAGRIVQRDAGDRRGFRNRLLIEHGRAGLSADGGQTVIGQGEGFADTQGRRVGGPSRIIEHGLGGAGHRVPDVGSIGVPRPQVGKNRAVGGLGEVREHEVRAHRVIPLHAERGGAGVVRPPIDPDIAFPIFKSERRVGGRRRGRGRRIRINGSGDDFHVFDKTGGVERLRQERQRHRRVQDGAGGDRIGKLVGGVFPQHFIDRDGGSVIGGIGVFDQDARQRGEGGAHTGAGGQVQIIAQGVADAALDQGVFLVWIIAGFGRVGLVVDRAAGDAGRQAAGADIRSHDDLFRQRIADLHIIDPKGFIRGGLVEGGGETHRDRGRGHTAGGGCRDHDIEALIEPTAVAIEIPIAPKHRRDRPAVFNEPEQGTSDQRGGDFCHRECPLENDIAIDHDL